jgi:hypothetical protein
VSARRQSGANERVSPHLVALVRAGASFEAGRLVERPKEAPDDDIDEVAA